MRFLLSYLNHVRFGVLQTTFDRLISRPVNQSRPVYGDDIWLILDRSLLVLVSFKVIKYIWDKKRKKNHDLIYIYICCVVIIAWDVYIDGNICVSFIWCEVDFEWTISWGCVMRLIVVMTRMTKSNIGLLFKCDYELVVRD